MSQGCFRKENCSREGREAVGDYATFLSIKAFQLGNFGDAEKRKPSG